jgi:hypothetical protein
VIATDIEGSMQAAEVMVVGALDLQATPPRIAAEMTVNARVVVSDRDRNMITSQVRGRVPARTSQPRAGTGNPRMDRLPAVSCSLQNRRTR